MTDTRFLIDETVRDFHSSWKTLALTDIAYKIIAFILLAPLVGFLFRLLFDAPTMSTRCRRTMSKS